MVRFDFRINPTFLTNTMHHVTVPKSIVPLAAMHEHGLDRGGVTVIYPRGERLWGYMYHGRTTQRGQYYQIRHRATTDFPTYFKQGQKLLVVILRVRDEIYAILEFQDMS